MVADTAGRRSRPAHFLHVAGSASILTKTTTTTDRAWKPRCTASCVKYQSVSGTRLGDSFRKRWTGATKAAKSSEELLFTSDLRLHVNDWSADGRTLVLQL